MRTLARLLVAALVVALLPAAPAAAASCFPAGGASIPEATPSNGDFMVTGRGWGHGVGMSQYGAQGAGNLGCSAAQILTTYFPGTAVGSASLPSTIRVSLDTDATSVPVEAHTGPIPWELCQSGCSRVATQAAGESWTVSVQGNGSYRLMDGSSVVWQGGSTSGTLRALLNGKVARVRVDTAYRYRWGAIEFASRGDAAGRAFVTAKVPFEQYLYGLSEVPSSWPAATLQAQAIAGRSYALKRALRYEGNRSGCRCDVYATVVDQHYTGYEKAADPTWGPRWTAAVDATHSQVLRYGSGIADTFYSSSHGGYSESSAFVWGGDVPYLRPVNDTRWEQASSNPAGNLTWSRTYSAGELGAAFGVGNAVRVTLPAPRGHAGRVGDPSRGAGGVVIQGTSATKRVSGDAFRRTLGLKSTLFDVRRGSPDVLPVPGWSSTWGSHPGDGMSAPGVVSWGDGRSDLFAVDASGRLVHRWLAAGRGWAPGGSWESLGSPPGVRLVGQPAPVARQAQSLNVFVRGSDGALWQRWYRRTTGWSAWQRLGGSLASSPAAVSWGPDHIAVVATGPDRAVWQRSFTGSWSSWRSLGGTVSSAPSVASWGPGRLDVFVRGGGGALYHRYFDGGRWLSPWVNKGGVLAGGGRPDAVAWGHGRLDVFVVGGGALVYRKSYQRGHGWLPTSGFERLDASASAGAFRSGTAALSWTVGDLEVFASDGSGRLWSRSTR